MAVWHREWSFGFLFPFLNAWTKKIVATLPEIETKGYITAHAAWHSGHRVRKQNHTISGSYPARV
jgi:hypothetical protein